MNRNRLLSDDNRKLDPAPRAHCLGLSGVISRLGCLAVPAEPITDPSAKCNWNHEGNAKVPCGALAPAHTSTSATTLLIGVGQEIE